MATNSNSGELTPRKRRTIAAILSERDLKAAAEAAGVGYPSLLRWLGDPIFRTALLHAEGDTIDAAARRLLGLQDSAIDTLAAILGKPQANDGVRLRAAQAVLDYLLKLRELRNVEARLTALEEAVSIYQGGRSDGRK